MVSPNRKRLKRILLSGPILLGIGFIGVQIYQYALIYQNRVASHERLRTDPIPVDQHEHVRNYQPTTLPLRGFVVYLTPENMNRYGFDIQFRFRDGTIKRGPQPTTRTGTVTVQAFFDTRKRKMFEQVKGVSLVVMDGEKATITAPLYLVNPETGNSVAWTQFFLDDSVMGKAALIMDVPSGMRGITYVVPISDFDR
jgi:hypothetical protein